LESESQRASRQLATDLVVAQEPIQPEAGLAERIAKLGDLPQCAIKLGYSETVLDKFPEEPQAIHVHIIVEPPVGESR